MADIDCNLSAHNNLVFFHSLSSPSNFPNFVLSLTDGESLASISQLAGMGQKYWLDHYTVVKCQWGTSL